MVGSEEERCRELREKKEEEWRGGDGGSEKRGRWGEEKWRIEQMNLLFRLSKII